MNKVAVVYWSGTGNTQAMAEAVAQAAGAELFAADAFNGDLVENYDAIGFGCPSMGSEQLEEGEFEPMFEGCKSHLSGKKIALFGSYGWGDGEWMRNWEADCAALGATLVADCVICQETPDDEALTACEALGKALAEG
ncbi:MAG TPA: flavodoxin domain-containing protein [Candidatus Pullichristensenella stercorigallinarum]|uniref:Flavodoxin domain-containing protein n=1 Tax=Candidatus Pullichristensenella stercorigallinarum TaxID=2840909 RepID=A0A9D0ZQM9_9FIRM|nr:flavodoxin domain-containing protein [Candidatus Pullichristensenella stercorigallinarum]